MEDTNIAETMRSHFKACKASGLTIKAYCLTHQIKHSVYYYWQKKLQPQLQPGKFVQIAPVVSNAPMSVIFTNGNRISFEAMPPVEYVKQLLS
jgi:hypothetical protein